MARAITDIAFRETGDGGDISLVNEDIEVTRGLFNQVYLALFGGNIEQSTSDSLNDASERFDWWGNNYLDSENQFNSSFERTLSQIVLNSAGLVALENAAKSDLEYLSEYADISVSGEITGVNRFKLSVTLKRPDSITEKAVFIWDGTRNEIIQYETI